MKTTTSPFNNSMNLSPVRLAFVLIPVVLACFSLSSQVRATCQNDCSGTNTFQGEEAFLNNTTGEDNTAVGFRALLNNVTGADNTANGSVALVNNTSGNDNTAIGFSALLGNFVGSNNTAIGVHALQNGTTGTNNTAIGANTFINNNGNGNIALGAGSGDNLRTGSNNIYIGNAGADESKTIRIGAAGAQGKTFIAGIAGVTIPGGVGVVIGTNGHLGTTTSSARFKEEIKPMDKASEVILAFKPVTFRYKHELDPDGISQFGLVAEEVEKVNPDLVARDDQGKPYTVRYEAVNAMLLNEFLKEHSHVQEQDAIIAQQQKQIDALTAGLHKVSAQLELNGSAPQTVQKK
jgi:hypothetical protein